MNSINRRKFITDAVIRAQARRRLNTMEINTAEVQATMPAVKKLFQTKAAYLAMKASWAKNYRTQTPQWVVLYNLLRGVDSKRGFTVVTNKNKLANGAAPEYAYTIAVTTLKWNFQVNYPDRPIFRSIKDHYLSVFGPTVIPEIITEALKGLE